MGQSNRQPFQGERVVVGKGCFPSKKTMHRRVLHISGVPGPRRLDTPAMIACLHEANGALVPIGRRIVDMSLAPGTTVNQGRLRRYRLRLTFVRAGPLWYNVWKLVE